MSLRDPYKRGSQLQGHPRQNGLTLVVVLVFLIMLMLIGGTSMQTAGVEERMASNARDKAVAFEAAEAALRIGEAAAGAAGSTDFKQTCENGLCAKTYAPNASTYSSWSLSDATIKHFGIDRTKLENGIAADLAYNPGYYAEYLGSQNLGAGIGSKTVIRVTAHAPGRDATTQVTLQSLIYQN